MQRKLGQMHEDQRVWGRRQPAGEPAFTPTAVLVHIYAACIATQNGIRKEKECDSLLSKFDSKVLVMACLLVKGEKDTLKWEQGS